MYYCQEPGLKIWVWPRPHSKVSHLRLISLCSQIRSHNIFLVPLRYAGSHLRLQYIKPIQRLILYFSEAWQNIKTKSLMLRNRKCQLAPSLFRRLVRHLETVISFEHWELIWLSLIQRLQAFCQDISTTVNICTILPSSLSGAQPNTVLCFTSSNEMACSQELCFLTVFFDEKDCSTLGQSVFLADCICVTALLEFWNQYWHGLCQCHA